MKKNNWQHLKVDETKLKPSLDMPEEIGKNRWLHPTDGLGKMTQGVARNSVYPDPSLPII